jgi:hypothetical protein
MTRRGATAVAVGLVIAVIVAGTILLAVKVFALSGAVGRQSREAIHLANAIQGQRISTIAANCKAQDARRVAALKVIDGKFSTPALEVARTAALAVLDASLPYENCAAKVHEATTTKQTPKGSQKPKPGF